MLLKELDCFTPDVETRYAPLILVLKNALFQAALGKGAERHAQDGEVFLQQPICELSFRFGTGFALGQAAKKIFESFNLTSPQHRVHELLGAINYIAAAIVVENSVNEENGDVM